MVFLQGPLVVSIEDGRPAFYQHQEAPKNIWQLYLSNYCRRLLVACSRFVWVDGVNGSQYIANVDLVNLYRQCRRNGNLVETKCLSAD